MLGLSVKLILNGVSVDKVIHLYRVLSVATIYYKLYLRCRQYVMSGVCNLDIDAFVYCGHSQVVSWLYDNLKTNNHDLCNPKLLEAYIIIILVIQIVLMWEYC